MEKAKKPSSQLLDHNPKCHYEIDNLVSLKLLADLVVQMGPIDTKETSARRLLPVSRSSRHISVTWKVKENGETKLTFNKNSDPRPVLVSTSGRPISVSREVKENCACNPALDNTMYSPDIVYLAKILVQMLNEKSETRIWGSSKEERKYAAINLETTDKNLDETKQLNEKKCISETTAQGYNRKRKLPSGEMQAKSRKKMKREPHVCEICGKSFATGVQLGGHKRAHFVKEPAESAKCWSIRKCADSELHFYLTIRKNDKCVSSNGDDL